MDGCVPGLHIESESTEVVILGRGASVAIDRVNVDDGIRCWAR